MALADKGNFVPTFFDKFDYIALVQFFMSAYFLASRARRAPGIFSRPGR
jgi:hypothetical protein